MDDIFAVAPVLGLHHIGFAVKDMKEAILDFEQLGYSLRGPVYDDSDRGCRGCFMYLGCTAIELISPRNGGGDRRLTVI